MNDLIDDIKALTVRVRESSYDADMTEATKSLTELAATLLNRHACFLLMIGDAGAIDATAFYDDCLTDEASYSRNLVRAFLDRVSDKVLNPDYSDVIIV